MELHQGAASQAPQNPLMPDRSTAGQRIRSGEYVHYGVGFVTRNYTKNTWGTTSGIVATAKRTNDAHKHLISRPGPRVGLLLRGGALLLLTGPEEIEERSGNRRKECQAGRQCHFTCKVLEYDVWINCVVSSLLWRWHSWTASLERYEVTFAMSRLLNVDADIWSRRAVETTNISGLETRPPGAPPTPPVPLVLISDQRVGAWREGYHKIHRMAIDESAWQIAA
ncbi:hypothetical protein MYCTH_2113353 [Thermothelomyces thermophilus ATCC 42464]|uniref:Uncharacterized protein n=1 Tax=Thermothelomyces thermophilus (strain ATCC 42464 / BCRC 31852 / DSM 1799) TaxID=573729 RepID=G2QPC5_THET4|nr:uncharacterized protein MYCTH_2113353 [Thermothelomyces thermophilus ATCC 42464]AEO61438.1 hypothetical protein MYCTH_2113353 [Thermothelomyces thermophilus ATCC 42464]